MRSVARSLLWKEWHERKWQFAAALAWIACGVGYLLVYESLYRHRTPVSRYYAICLIYGLFGSVFVAMRTSLSEVTQHTRQFSAALPTSLRRIAGVRLLGGLAVLLCPVLIGALLVGAVIASGALEQVPPRPTMDAYVRALERPSLAPYDATAFFGTIVAVIVAGIATQFLFLAVVGTRLRSEAQVGFLGALIGFLWILTVGWSVQFGTTEPAAWQGWLGAVLPQALAMPASYGDTDGSGYDDLGVARRVGGPLLLNLVFLAALAALFARQFDRRFRETASAGKRPREWGLPALLSRWPVRLPGRWGALAWLDLRQSVPLALAGLALACGYTAVQLYAEPHWLNAIGLDPLTQEPLRPTMAQAVAARLPGGTWIIAELWSVVVAAGIFSAELQPALGQFWRSRPIRPAAWFAAKYLIGLVAVLGALDGLTILVSWGSPYSTGAERMSRSYIACMPLLHAATYSLAVFGVCWLRRPVPGAMVGMLTFFLGSFLLDLFPATRHLEPVAVYNKLFFAEYPDSHLLVPQARGVFDLTSHHYPVVYGTIAAIFVVAALLAAVASVRVEPTGLPRRRRQAG